jgi:hypothetical protein
MFRVEWFQSALNELAAVWMQAAPSERQAITKASHLIDQELVENPQEKGESRPKGRRIEFFSPLAVTYRVDIVNYAVMITHVWRYRQRNEQK